MIGREVIHNDILGLLGPHEIYTDTDERGQNDDIAFKCFPTLCTEPLLDKPLPPIPTSVNTHVPAARIPEPIYQEFDRAIAPSFLDANDIWRQRYRTALRERKWIDPLFCGKDIFFGERETGYAWELGQQVSEMTRIDSNQQYASAMYECTQIKGRIRGPRAYMKIYMQLPQCCLKCDQIYSRPSKVPKRINDEVMAMRRLLQLRGNVVAPKLLATKTKVQTRNMWVPGGFLVFTVMQRLPGTILDVDTFWKHSMSTRDEIRRSLRRALQILWQLGVMPQDCAIDKLAWNSKTRLCYIINLEGAVVAESPLSLWAFEYFKWGLSQTCFDELETSFYSELEASAESSNQRVLV